MMAPSRGRLRGLLLFFRRAARDCANIGGIGANIVRLVVRIAGELLEYGPIGPASLKEAREREHFHEGLHCLILIANEYIGVRSLVSLVNLRQSHN